MNKVALFTIQDLTPNHAQTEIARRIGVSRKHISEIVNGRKGISTDIALRLSRLFGTSPELWLNGQIAWDVWYAMRGENAYKLEAIEPVATSVSV